MKPIPINKIVINALVPLLLVVALSCTNDTEAPEDIKDRPTFITDYLDLKLKGNVKSFVFYVYNQGDTLTNSESYQFNRHKETIDYKKFHDINGNQIHEINLYNKNGTNINRETYKNGNLVTKKTTIDSLDSNGRVVKKSTYNIENNLIRTISYVYLPNGKLASKNSTKLDNGEYSKITYSYNSNHILKKFNYTEYDKDSSQTKKITEDFNDLGKPILKEIYFQKEEPSDRKIYKYDSLNNLVEVIDFSSNSSFYWKRQINYNEEGLKLDSICQFYWSPNPEEEESSIRDEEVHEFNLNGQIVKQVFKDKGRTERVVILKYSKGNSLKEKITTYSDQQTSKTAFNPNGNEILIQDFDKEGNLTSEEKYKIEYDSHQNITKVRIEENGVNKISVIKKYEYY